MISLRFGRTKTWRTGQLDTKGKIKVIDYSDSKGFAFGFSCGLCGFEWRSDRIPFDMTGFSDKLSEEDMRLLWKEERQRQYEIIKANAAIEFNRCPECGTWVCDECFFVDCNEITDFCLECIDEIKEEFKKVI